MTNDPQALAAAVLEEAARVCWRAAKHRREQIDSADHPKIQVQRWQAGAMQAEFLAHEISALITPVMSQALDRAIAEAVAQEKSKHKITCYWDAEDRAEGHLDIWEILDGYDWGEVAEIEHVAIVTTTFEAQLPPADDNETDDLFEVCEQTREAAEAKIAAELERRTAIRKGES